MSAMSYEILEKSNYCSLYTETNTGPYYTSALKKLFYFIILLAKQLGFDCNYRSGSSPLRCMTQGLLQALNKTSSGTPAGEQKRPYHEVTGDIICPSMVQGIDHIRDPRLNKVSFFPNETNVANLVFKLNIISNWKISFYYCGGDLIRPCKVFSKFNVPAIH